MRQDVFLITRHLSLVTVVSAPRKFEKHFHIGALPLSYRSIDAPDGIRTRVLALNRRVCRLLMLGRGDAPLVLSVNSLRADDQIAELRALDNVSLEAIHARVEKLGESRLNLAIRHARLDAQLALRVSKERPSKRT